MSCDIYSLKMTQIPCLVQESENIETHQPTAFHAKDFARKIFGVKAVV